MGNYWTTRGPRIARRRLLATAGLAGASLATAATIGCGDDDDDGGGPSAQASQTPAQPQRGGNIVFHYGGADSGNVDPHQLAQAGVVVVGPGIVYGRLMRSKVAPGQSSLDVIPEGDLAESWEQPDENTYIYKLRGNAKWHNVAPVNGRAVNAEDIVYSLNRQRTLRSAAGALPALKTISATDARTVRLESPSPDADFLVSMAAAYNVVVAKEVVDAKGDLKEGPFVGTSPWIFNDWVRNNTLKFTRNPDYFRPGVPYADSLEILRITDASLSQQAFRTKRLNWITATGSNLDLLKREVSGVKVQEARYTGGLNGNCCVLKADQPPTNDPRVRKAVNKAINRKVIKDAMATPSWLGGPLMHVTREDYLLPEAEFERLLDFNPNEARQLLQQAGVTDWKPKITTLGTDTTLAELVQGQLRAVGINAVIEPVDAPAIGQWYAQHNREFVVFLRGPQAWGTNADLRASYKAGASFNTSNISDPELDRMIDSQAGELKDTNRRKTILQDIQRRLIDLAAVTPVHANIHQILYHPNVHNVLHYYPVYIETSGYELVWFDK